MKTGSQFIADSLNSYGVTHVFFVPAIMSHTLAQLDLRTDIKRVMTHGEKSAAYMADGYARASGRPILISARGIIDPEYSLAYGMDVKTWLAEDLIDILMPIHPGIPRGKHQSSLKEFYDLAHRYNVLAYANVRYHRVYQHTWEACRGETIFRFAEGADGITTFNRFDPTHRMWWELGDPEVLRDLDKTYTCPHYFPLSRDSASNWMKQISV